MKLRKLLPQYYHALNVYKHYGRGGRIGDDTIQLATLLRKLYSGARLVSYSISMVNSIHRLEVYSMGTIP